MKKKLLIGMFLCLAIVDVKAQVYSYDSTVPMPVMELYDKKDWLMKRLTLMLLVSVFAIAAKAQYNVGTSSTTTDYFGNQTTTHRDQYGNTTGTSTTTTDVIYEFCCSTYLR